MYGLFTRRNLITMLMSIELMLNSVNINFVAFNKYLFPGQLDGLFFSLFIITIAAAEAAVAIAIIINWPLPLSLIYIVVINLLM